MSARWVIRAAERRAQRELANELPVVRDRLLRAGLYATAKKMDAVVKEVGWEIARLEAKSPS